MAVETAEDLFLDELKDIYSAEKQAVRAYPRLTKVVQSEELKQAMQQHLEQTKGQIERLDRIFELLEKRAGGKTCEGMKGLLDEASAHVEEIERGPVLDAAIIGALQRVEHYEIAAYGTVAALAEMMGQDEVHELLGETLEEEKETDGKLTQIASAVNTEAMGSGEEDAEEDAEEEGAENEEEEPEPSTQAKKRSSAKKAKSASKRAKGR